RIASQPERGPFMRSARATDSPCSTSRRRLLQGAASTTALALAVPSLARAAEPIKVGVLQPLSGGLENLGQQGVQGTRLAIEEANEAGGVRGRRFELVIADDKTDPKTAVERTREMIEAVRRAAEQVGGKIVGEEYTPFGVKDFTSTVRKIEQSGAKVLVLDVVGADAITFVKQFVAAGGKAKTKLAWLGYSENYIPGLTRDESESIVTVANFISTLDKPEAKAFVAKVKKRFGEAAIVSNTVDAHYMLTRFFIEGVKRAGAVDKEKIIDAVTGFQLESGNGMVRLRPEDRHADLNVVIAETKNQRQVLLKDLGLDKAQS